MSHTHEVKDTDIHYKIDGITRTITNVDETKRMLVQNDHNSERLTFEVPRYVDGHDLTECNVVQVHYLNSDTFEKNKSAGIYEVDDLRIKGETESDKNIVILSWLVSGNATKFVGNLDFVIRFSCVVDGNVDYAWNTAIFKGISILPGIYNSEDVVNEHADILELWRNQLFEESVDCVKTVNGIAPDENGNVVVNGGIGADGFSPIAFVNQTDSGAVISITDKDGTTTATITNGKDGKDGADGAPGEKGDKGDTGAPGADGAKGDKGDKGETGDTGAQGDPGKDGVDGVGIAYVEDTHDGTMEVYSTDNRLLGVITLPKGKDGKDGEDGVDGVGIASVDDPQDGTAEFFGTNGAILGVVTLPRGPKGDPGDKGDKGDKGDAGVGIASIEDCQDGTMEIYSTADTLLGVITLPKGDKGDKGDPGDPGDDGVGIAYVEDLEDGRMEVWGTNQKLLGTIALPQADKGDPGDDGISPTVEVKKSGKATTVTFTDKDGKKTATINDGADGVGIASVDDPGDGTVEFFGTNGEILGVVTLPKGKDGEDGAPGKTPVKGTDYFTAADKAEIVAAVIAALPVYAGEVV